MKGQDFVEVAREYRLIPDDAVNLLVPYDVTTFRALVHEARNGFLTIDWIRRARPHVVNIYRPRSEDAALWTHIEAVPLRDRSPSTEWFFCRSEKHYDANVCGLSIPDSANVLIS